MVLWERGSILKTTNSVWAGMYKHCHTPATILSMYLTNYYLSVYHDYHPQSFIIYLCINLCSSALAVTTKYHRLGGLNIKTLLYLVLWEPKIKVLANLASAEICLPATSGFMGACLLVCRHMAFPLCAWRKTEQALLPLLQRHLSTWSKGHP